jgi:hypothetical protein
MWSFHKPLTVPLTGAAFLSVRAGGLARGSSHLLGLPSQSGYNRQLENQRHRGRSKVFVAVHVLRCKQSKTQKRLRVLSLRSEERCQSSLILGLRRFVCFSPSNVFEWFDGLQVLLHRNCRVESSTSLFDLLVIHSDGSELYGLHSISNIGTIYLRNQVFSPDKPSS